MQFQVDFVYYLYSCDMVGCYSSIFSWLHPVFLTHSKYIVYKQELMSIGQDLVLPLGHYNPDQEKDPSPLSSKLMEQAEVCEEQQWLYKFQSLPDMED